MSTVSLDVEKISLLVSRLPTRKSSHTEHTIGTPMRDRDIDSTSSIRTGSSQNSTMDRASRPLAAKNTNIDDTQAEAVSTRDNMRSTIASDKAP